jgi:formamidopyrimidine-DNA glycosylase
MPELPEVETITRQLRVLVVGRTIVTVEVLDHWTVKYPSPPEFVAGIEGQKIEAVDRRAKRILIRLTSGQFLTVQLMTTGQFLLTSPDAAQCRSTRLILNLDENRQLRLVDSSRYARVNLLHQDELGSRLKLDDLGPEAISDQLTLAQFRQMLGRRRRPIKALLLDQAFISGIGNIYADESLFAARIHPIRAAGSLREDEVSRLYTAIRSIMREAIAMRGTTTRSYLDVLGRKGEYQKRLRVVHRTGERCTGCPGLVEQIEVAGRETFLCPSCQIMEPAEARPGDATDRKTS